MPSFFGHRRSRPGIALGVAAALAVTRSLSALLYGVTSADAVTYGLVALVLAIVCVTVRAGCRLGALPT